jgi:hypothetical protein
LFTGSQQAKVQREIANANMAATADGIKNGVLAQRDAGKANVALGMFGPIFGATTASDLDFGRQLAVERFKLNEFAPRQMALGREQAEFETNLGRDQTRWETAFRNSGAYQNLAQKERMGKLKERIAAARAEAPPGMFFGPIAHSPIESFMV